MSAGENAVKPADQEAAPRAAAVAAANRTRWLGRVNWGASSLLVLVIVGAVNWLAFRHFKRWDWTSQGIYSLSDRTKHELRALSVPVTIHLFMSEVESNFPEVNELLQRYKAESSKISVQVIDPDRHPSEYMLEAKKFNVGIATDVDTGKQVADVAAVIVAGEKRWSVTRDDLVALDVESLDDDSGPQIDVKAEQALTGAIVQVVSGAPTKVCITRGHGEWSAEGQGQGRSLAALATELRRDNVTMEPVETRGQKAISPDCNVLFVVGPVRAFSDEERSIVRTYVMSGGNVLFALDPVIDNNTVVPNGLEPVLAEWGIDLGDTVVLELDGSRLPAPASPVGPFFVVDYGQHRATESLRALQTPTIMSMVRSVRPTRDGVTTLLLTSKNAYAERNIAELSGGNPTRGDGDLDGPVSLAVAATPGLQSDVANKKSGGRVIVLGDSDWLSTELMRPDLANRDLIDAFTGWLTQREALISIAPKKLSAQRLTISTGSLSDLFFRLIVLIPGAVMILGLSAWWARRS